MYAILGSESPAPQSQRRPSWDACYPVFSPSSCSCSRRIRRRSDRPFASSVVKALQARGIKDLYLHQERALTATRDGSNAFAATSTVLYLRGESVDERRRVISHNTQDLQGSWSYLDRFQLPCLGRCDEYPCPPDSEELMWYLLHMESGADGAIAVRSHGDWEGLGHTSPKNKGQVSAFPRTGGESAGFVVRRRIAESRRLGAGICC